MDNDIFKINKTKKKKKRKKPNKINLKLLLKKHEDFGEKVKKKI
jgi:hypothetical protein